MAIWGIEGGIGTGKTLSLVYLGVMDLYQGKTLYSNVALKNIPKKFKERIVYLTKAEIHNIFESIKDGRYDMRNSTVIIQEAHNYIDSRNSQTQKNKTLTYWILQSRHTGQGSCDIIYDTQDFGQVDIRLRRNTDYFIQPYIIEKVKGAPSRIALVGKAKVRHTWTSFYKVIDVTLILNNYDTHEIVDF